jgi:ArsR family transcriptional regulator, arsenate/arsenite/antimonite-responsive transcriptional repressor
VISGANTVQRDVSGQRSPARGSSAHPELGSQFAATDFQSIAFGSFRHNRTERFRTHLLLDKRRYFHISRSMEKTDAVAALAALAQDNRLDVFRLLVRAGPEGMPAGAIAEALELAPNTLTFHFDRLRHAELVAVRREGRSMIYAARYETMNALLAFLTENCCAGMPEKCAPAVCTPARSRRAKATTT